MITEAVYQFVQLHYIELLSVLPVTFLLAGLVFCICFDRYLREWNKRRMMLICILVFSLIVQNYLDYLLTRGRPMIMMRRMVDIYGYFVRPVILLLFLYIVYPGGRYRPVWILAGANALIYLTGLFSDISFTIDAENRFQGGMPVLRNSCLILSLFLLGLLLYLVLRHFRPLHLQETLIPLFVTFLILLALLLDSSVLNVSQPVSFLTIAIVISCVLFYNWLHSRFVEEYEQAIATQQRIQIMMTQIQPHFLYNTLATIRSLCQRSPETAARLIEKFSRYLRQNLDAPNLPDLIPFRQLTNLFCALIGLLANLFVGRLDYPSEARAVKSTSTALISMLSTAVLAIGPAVLYFNVFRKQGVTFATALVVTAAFLLVLDLVLYFLMNSSLVQKRWDQIGK